MLTSIFIWILYETPDIIVSKVQNPFKNLPAQGLIASCNEKYISQQNNLRSAIVCLEDEIDNDDGIEHKDKIILKKDLIAISKGIEDSSVQSFIWLIALLSGLGLAIGKLFLYPNRLIGRSSILNATTLNSESDDVKLLEMLEKYAASLKSSGDEIVPKTVAIDGLERIFICSDNNHKRLIIRIISLYVKIECNKSIDRNNDDVIDLDATRMASMFLAYRYQSNKRSKLNLPDDYLSNCHLSNINMEKLAFESTNFSGTIFVNSTLSNAKFSKANLAGATFKEVGLEKSDFTEAILENTKFENVDLSEVKGMTHKQWSKVIRGEGVILPKFSDTPDSN